MKSVPVQTLNGTFEATGTRALYWPDERLVVVSDLHLGKSERVSRRSGQMLPPYETQDTVIRLTEVIEFFAPKHVICLGDSFDDSKAAGNLDQPVLAQINYLMEGRDWIWIEGNHDPVPPSFGGQFLREIQIRAVTFRHIAEVISGTFEISGHFHPKSRLTIKQTTITRPCFTFDTRRLIMPSFGTYTGGLDCSNRAIADLMGPDAKAILTGTAPHIIPFPR